MNLLRILLTFNLLVTLKTSAQLLILKPEYLFEKFPVFNQSYIYQYKIKSIIFNIIDKKDWQEAEDKNLIEVYEFDTAGQLKRQYHTSVRKIIQYETHRKKNKATITKEFYEYDTISTEYVYQKNLFIERRKWPNHYTEADYYRIYGKWICKEEKYVETYRTLSTGNQILDKMLLKASDSIASYDYGRQIKQVYYNNEKLPYKEKFIYKNEDQQIYEITEQLTVANGKIKKTFEYNDNNTISKANMIIDYGQTEIYQIQFNYDDKKRLFSENHFKNNQALKEYQYIYDENNQLKSILIRTFENKNIRIIKLKFEYY